MAIYATATCLGTVTTTAGYSTVVPLNWRQPSFNASIQVIGSATTAEYSVLYTLYPVLASGTAGATWITADSSSGLHSITGTTATAGEVGTLVAPVTAVQLKCTASAAGNTATMTVIQGDE